jgi:hypothetical protein
MKNYAFSRIGYWSSVFLTAKAGSIFVLPYAMDIPKRTCKKYGVTLKVAMRKNLQIKIVTVLVTGKCRTKTTKITTSST